MELNQRFACLHTHTHAHLNIHIVVIMLRLKYSISSSKFRLSSQKDLCEDYFGCIVSIFMHFLSSFRCRESGQTSESIVGAALIPNPQAIFASFYVLTSKNKDIASKYLVCECVYTRTDLSVPACVLYVPLWALSASHLFLVVFFFFMSLWTPRCRKLQNWKNNLVIMQDSYLD